MPFKPDHKTIYYGPIPIYFEWDALDGEKQREREYLQANLVQLPSQVLPP